MNEVEAEFIEHLTMLIHEVNAQIASCEDPQLVVHYRGMVRGLKMSQEAYLICIQTRAESQLRYQEHLAKCSAAVKQ